MLDDLQDVAVLVGTALNRFTKTCASLVDLQSLPIKVQNLDRGPLYDIDLDL